MLKSHNAQKSNTSLVQKTAVQDYECKRSAWILAAENYTCTEVFKKQYLHY